MTPDPSGLAAVDLSNPQSLNRYAYALNAPTMYLDPLGLDVWQIGNCFINYHYDSEGELHMSFGGCIDGSAGGGGEPEDGGGGGTPTTPEKKSPCANLPSNGRTIPVRSQAGQINLQFDGNGTLIGIGVQLTGQVPFTTSNMFIPSNTFVGISRTGPDTIQFGFNNPVKFSAGVASVKQAYFQTATFSGGNFTEVRGAWSPWGIFPWGSTTGTSAILRSALNGDPTALQFANALRDMINTISRNVGCSTLLGGS